MSVMEPPDKEPERTCLTCPEGWPRVTSTPEGAVVQHHPSCLKGRAGAGLTQRQQDIYADRQLRGERDAAAAFDLDTPLSTDDDDGSARREQFAEPGSSRPHQSLNLPELMAQADANRQRLPDGFTDADFQALLGKDGPALPPGQDMQPPLEKAGSLEEAQRRHMEQEIERQAQLTRPYDDEQPPDEAGKQINSEPEVPLPPKIQQIRDAWEFISGMYTGINPILDAQYQQFYAQLRADYREAGEPYGPGITGAWRLHGEYVLLARHQMAIQHIIQDQEQMRALYLKREQLRKQEWEEDGGDQLHEPGA